MRRPAPLGENKEVTRVLAIDCEMVGSGPLGMDSRLASVSVVNADGNQVYFSYAVGTRPVTDYRTKYSGITPELLEGAPPISQVQQEVASLLHGKLVVGHGLENDFKALGYFHPRILTRDTAHDLPRLLSRAGRPRKLRRITWEFLGLTIQDGEHDPLEDARAALLLYLRYQSDFEALAEARKKDHAQDTPSSPVVALPTEGLVGVPKVGDPSGLASGKKQQ
uniref:RNA exonuclease 4 n=1 Tax=Haptolina ericina TaxID=156174 RepID=A0A7S3ADY6_9EUKA|mmetsp:Transcript_12149/g.27732  ORF Transcript_12149/g.27732 Transcript_12149/m.27732 type:complete len:222 (+) Transcript_12149:407-1072(+)